MPASIPARKLRSLRSTQRLRTMSSMLRPLFLWKAMSLVEGHVAHPARLRLAQIIATGKAAIRRCLTRRRAVSADVALQHRHEPVTVGRVAGFDHQIEDQAAPAGGQGELVTVLDVAAALDD